VRARGAGRDDRDAVDDRCVEPEGDRAGDQADVTGRDLHDDAACDLGAAPADVLDLAEPELEEDRVDVLLHRALGEEQLVGDRLVAAAARDKREDLGLAGRQVRQR
jgi:hypothetical protein